MSPSITSLSQSLARCARPTDAADDVVRDAVVAGRLNLKGYRLNHSRATNI